MYEFSTSTLMFWIKGSIELDNYFVKVEIPNTILGIFPLGNKKDSIPLHTISNLQMNTSYKLLPLIIGGILLMGSLPMIFTDFFGGVVLSAINFSILGSGIKTTLTSDKSGGKQVISVPFFESKTLYAAQEDIYDLISEKENHKDLCLYFEKR